ncbi:MAG: hypothetical protein IJF74_04290 [Clostridia bacterium]|nr:hypothetical protein [Clostridia bacterium]
MFPFLAIYFTIGGDGTVSYIQPAAVTAAFRYLPERVFCAINETAEKNGVRLRDISEVRLRRNMQISLSLDRVNMHVPYVCGDAEMEYVTNKLCKGSVYAYEHHLREGYIPAEGGMRVAVNTAVRYTDGKMRREYIPESIVFRIPVHTEGESERLARLMSLSPGGMIIFSPPAVGKTTVLRDLVITLSRGKDPMRVAVVDCREEINDGKLPESCLVDIISGCERSAGMEWALRTLSPQVIAVDELSVRDSAAVCRAASCGVPVIATVHAGGFDEVLSHTEIRDAFVNGAFSYLVHLARARGSAPEFEVRRYLEDRWIRC